MGAVAVPSWMPQLVPGELLAQAVIVALAGVLVWLPALAFHVLIARSRAVSVVGWHPGPGSSRLAGSGGHVLW